MKRMGRYGWMMAPLIVCVTITVHTATAADAPTVGWRGDGTGRYPDARPPITWDRRVVTPVSGVTSQARAPGDPATAGAAMLRAKSGFAPAELLVLAAFEQPEADRHMDEPLLPDEPALAPAVGQRAGVAGVEQTWRVAPTVAGRGVLLGELAGKALIDRIAYAVAWIHSPDEMDCGIRLGGSHGHVRVWLNGKRADGGEQKRHHLVKGWNRLVVKVNIRAGSSESSLLVELHAFPGVTTQFESKNIRWAAPMPGTAYSMPIIVGDRIYVTSEPNDLVCVEKASGKVLWVQSNTLWHAGAGGDEALADAAPLVKRLEEMTARWISGDYPEPGKPEPHLKPHELERRQFERRTNFLSDRRKLAAQITDDIRKKKPALKVELGWGGGNTAPTPVSDGTWVYAWYGETGVLACFDLAGKRRWTRFHHSGIGGEHGVNASPLIVGDRLVVLGGRRVLAIDRHSGELAWDQKYRHVCYASCIAMKAGGEDVIVAPDGMVMRASDGSVLNPHFGRHDGEVASPVRDDRDPRVFYLISRYGFCAARVADRIEEGKPGAQIIAKLEPDDLQETETYPVGSPLSHEGLVYATHSGWGPRPYPVLLVIDPKTPKVVYRQPLALTPQIHYGPEGAGVAASIALGGRHLYIFDNRGTCVVFEPGPTYKHVATNVIESIDIAGRQEITQSTPIFEGDCIYYRGQNNLYCIGQ